MNEFTATYSPDDNKLRLSACSRLEKDLYERVKSAGFRWAPRQEIFVCPAWSPKAEDLCLELAGEIGDEDTSLVERAEERAERFEDYSTKRSNDAERAYNAVDAIAQGIPIGQPILVGHHSEKHARRDAEKIQNGMRTAVKMWETSKYWTDRAAGALAHAKYKERPDVRARRIKGLEADIRRCKSHYTPDPKQAPIMQQRYSRGAYSEEPEPHVWCAPQGGRGGSWVPVASLPAIEKGYARWIAHYEMRLCYERAMLQESGGLVADRFEIELGGQVLTRRSWDVVLKINRTKGAITSVRTNARFCNIVKVEDIEDYRPCEDPTLAEKIKTVNKLPPLVNFPGENYKHITKLEYDSRAKYGNAFTKVVAGTDAHGAYRQRYYPGGSWQLVPCFITDLKVVEPPLLVVAAKVDLPEREVEPRLERARTEPAVSKFDALKDTLKAGVQVVAAPQLFPTPRDLARKMVRSIGCMAGHRVLEPSAGTGSLIEAIINDATGNDCLRLVAIEINPALAKQLENDRDKWLYANEKNYDIQCRDFLECGDELGKFSRIVMNPPFANGADIKHIRHAATMLRPGGQLVAICAGGPRQAAALEEWATTWEPLPAGTFDSSGTGVNTVLLTYVAPAVTERPKTSLFD